MLSPNLLERAIEITRSMDRALSQRYNVFSFIAKKSKICAIGCNDMTKTHPVAFYNNYEYPFIHSELAAILAFKDLANSHRYNFLNIRLGRGGSLRNSKPCIYCYGLLNQYNFKSIVYSTDHGFTC
jgi:tRNA(Arg) A34 adenosine deaminase TadA